jgi:hypothetical protein
MVLTSIRTPRTPECYGFSMCKSQGWLIPKVGTHHEQWHPEMFPRFTGFLLPPALPQQWSLSWIGMLKNYFFGLDFVLLKRVFRNHITAQRCHGAVRTCTMGYGFLRLSSGPITYSMILHRINCVCNCEK